MTGRPSKTKIQNFKNLIRYLVDSTENELTRAAFAPADQAEGGSLKKYMILGHHSGIRMRLAETKEQQKRIKRNIENKPIIHFFEFLFPHACFALLSWHPDICPYRHACRISFKCRRKNKPEASSNGHRHQTGGHQISSGTYVHVRPHMFPG